MRKRSWFRTVGTHLFLVLFTVATLYPVLWVLSLPLRLFGIGVEGVFATLRAVIMLPARVLRGPNPQKKN